jgi:hypothetical protein
LRMHFCNELMIKENQNRKAFVTVDWQRNFATKSQNCKFAHNEHPFISK